MNNIFIAGTDTDSGKTRVAVGLINFLNQQGFTTLGIKPVAAGNCQWQDEQLVNGDALALQQAANLSLPYQHINPFAFVLEASPHIGAQQTQTNLTVATLKEKCALAFRQSVDFRIIEGAGGWYVPLNAKETMADFVIAMNLPVILIVGVRLGCINHTILTYEAILKSGVPFLGWIANCIAPNMHAYSENIETLRQWLKVPCLGVIGQQQSVEEVFQQSLTQKLHLLKCGTSFKSKIT